MPATPAAVDVARQWFEQVWGQRDHTAVHRLMAAEGIGYLEPDLVINGPDHFVAVFHSLMETFPDMDLRIEDITGDDINAVVRWNATATHGGAGLGMAATGRKTTFRGMTWLTVKDGKVVEGWDCWNQGALMAQLTKA